MRTTKCAHGHVRPTLCPVNNGGATCSGDPVVVCLAKPSNGADVCLGEEVHGQVTQALLSDDHIRLVLDDLATDVPDVLLLHFQQGSPACNLTLELLSRIEHGLDSKKACCPPGHDMQERISIP